MEYGSLASYTARLVRRPDEQYYHKLSLLRQLGTSWLYYLSLHPCDSLFDSLSFRVNVVRSVSMWQETTVEIRPMEKSWDTMIFGA